MRAGDDAVVDAGVEVGTEGGTEVGTEVGTGVVAGVVVVGADAESVGASVAAQRSVGHRAAGFVGDPADGECVVAVRAMAAELFPDCEIVMPS